MSCFVSSSQDLRGSSFPLPHTDMLLVHQSIHYSLLPFKQSNFSSVLRIDTSQIKEPMPRPHNSQYPRIICKSKLFEWNAF